MWVWPIGVIWKGYVYFFRLVNKSESIKVKNDWIVVDVDYVPSGYKY